MSANSFQEEWDDSQDDPRTAALAAQLTEAAYCVALQHGIKGSFADLELALWKELRKVVAATGAEATVGSA